MSETREKTPGAREGVPQGGAFAALSLPARRAERRIRLRRALEMATTAACFALFAVSVALVLRKTGHIREVAARGVIGASFLCVGVAAIAAYLRPLAARAGAVALDRYHGLSDRISSALSFAELPVSERSSFMDLAILDGVRAAGSVYPRRAVPLRAPRDLGIAVGMLVATVGIFLFEVRQHVPVLASRTIEAVDVTADDLDAMREFVREQERKDQSEEAKAATQAFNQLIQDLAERRLDRTEAFRRMQSLEDKLLEGREADKKALEDSLQKIGEELKKAELTKPAGEALDSKNLPKAAEELRKLADKLREKGASIDKAELEKMREALKQASADNAARQQAIAQRREELQKDLLRDKQRHADKDGGASEEERSLLQKKERELERLQNEDEQNQAAGRQLDRLDRELAQAAEDLMRDLGASSKDLDQSAEDINRMAREEMTQEEKQEMKEKLEELRELLRQQGQNGSQQMVRLRRFQSRAHGQRGQGQGQGQKGQGQQGQGQEGEGQEGQEGQSGQGQQGQNGQGQQGQNGQGQQGQSGQGQQGPGQPGQGNMGGGSSGQGQRGQGQGSQGETWVLGPNGEKILMLSQGQGQGHEQGQGRGQGESGGDGHGKPQPGSWGTGHDEHVQGGATAARGGAQDTQIEGQDTGQGASRSEVIQGAAERGFASRGYTKVYREYHAVAEEALVKDEIPGGYRFYVRRYFQLIRPREP
jgi:hypothetical protein